MFTGIIQAVGEIKSITPQGASAENSDLALVIASDGLDFSDVQLGDSIAVNGACLTVTALEPKAFHVLVSQVSLAVTTGLGTLGPVNLEKAMQLSDRLGGHLVTGHVDGIGKISKIEQVGECWLLQVSIPHAISRYVAQKGSICVNGISLTVNAIAHDEVSINLIPHTMQHTSMQYCKAGDAVNIEIDLIARYVERMQAWSAE